MHADPRVAQFRVEMRLLAETLRLWLKLPARLALLAALGLVGVLAQPAPAQTAGLDRLEDWYIVELQWRSAAGLPGDIDYLQELAEVVKNSALCGLGQTAASAVLSAIKLWPDLFDQPA